jgi:hypothetical protein
VFSRDQLKRAASLTEEDFVQLGKCRRPHNRELLTTFFVTADGWVRKIMKQKSRKRIRRFTAHR